LTHLDKPILFNADLAGKLPQAEIRNLTFRYGSKTTITVNGEIADYAKFGDTAISVEIPNLRMSVEDLEDFIRIVCAPV
jgi:hypothetical protein